MTELVGKAGKGMVTYIIFKNEKETARLEMTLEEWVKKYETAYLTNGRACLYMYPREDHYKVLMSITFNGIRKLYWEGEVDSIRTTQVKVDGVRPPVTKPGTGGILTVWGQWRTIPHDYENKEKVKDSQRFIPWRPCGMDYELKDEDIKWYEDEVEKLKGERYTWFIVSAYTYLKFTKISAV